MNCSNYSGREATSRPASRLWDMELDSAPPWPGVRSGPGRDADSAVDPAAGPAAAGPAAVTALYREHALGLTRLALMPVRDKQAAEDIVQDAFCGLHRRWGHVRDTGKALAYVRSAVVNGCRSEWAANYGEIGHWNGTAWHKVSVASLLPRHTQYCAPLVPDIYAVSATDAWATGWQGCQDIGGQAVLLHYAGGRWHRVASLGGVVPSLLSAGPGAVLIQLDPDPQAPCHVKLVRYAAGKLHQLAVPLLSQIVTPSGTVLPDGTSFFAGTHNLGRHRTAGFVLRYRP